MVENMRTQDDSFFGFLDDESHNSESHSNSFSDFNDNHLGGHFELPGPVKVVNKPVSNFKQNEMQQQSKLKVRLIELSEDCSFPRKLDASNLKSGEYCIMEKDIDSIHLEDENKTNKNSLAKLSQTDEVVKAKEKKCKKNKKRKNKKKKEKGSNLNEQEPTYNAISSQSNQYKNEVQFQKPTSQYNMSSAYQINEHRNFNRFFPNPNGSSCPLTYPDQSCNYAYNYNMYPSVQYPMPLINFQPQFALNNNPNSSINPKNPVLTQVPENSSSNGFNLLNYHLGYNPSANSRFEFWKNK